MSVILPPVKHLYIHVPFCKGACSYCAFYKETFSAPALQKWLHALGRELAQATRPAVFPLETIYMGGGTPSLLDAQDFTKLYAHLKSHCDLEHLAEWSLEVNPESVTTEKLDAWCQAGVNRISVGVQSLQVETLRRMNRRHDVDTIYRAIELIRPYVEHRTRVAFPLSTRPADGSLGIDLIAGFPGVPDAAWQETLDGVLALMPDHLSVYECSLHPGTSLKHQIASGAEHESPPTHRNRALRMAAKTLTQAGYEHYETSNFCKPGKRCRHNLAIWRGEDYLGLGPGAASRRGQNRWTNQADVKAYNIGAETGAFPRETDHLTPQQDATERLMFAFRLLDPVDIRAYLPQDDLSLSANLLAFWRTQLRDLQSQGLVAQDGDGWRTTPLGADYVDTIAEALLPEY